MLNFQLLPSDKYDGRCAEIYITEKQFLIYHCSVCEEIYSTFNELLSHLTKGHYKNVKECSKVEIKNVEIIHNQENDKENQFAEKKLVKKANNSYKEFKSKLAVDKKWEGEFEQSFNDHHQETAGKIDEIKVPLENEDLSLVSHSSKSLPLRKKLRSGIIINKSNASGRTKIGTLTRYQVNLNDERKYACTICGFAFKEKYNLRSHLLRHSNRKHFSCCICPKTFFNKVELRLHEYRHKSERTYLCIHCGMGFLSSGSLTQHLRKHSMHRSLKCDQCYMFSNIYQHKDHQPIDSETFIIQCSECQLTLKTNENSSNNETKIHEHKLKIGFDNCDLKYKNLIALSNHQTQEHSLVVNSEHFMDTKTNERSKECKFILEQNFDEYELVQTLTDLECNKKV